MTNWKKYDLIRLALVKKVSSKDKRMIIDKFDNYDSFIKSKDLPDSVKQAMQPELFDVDNISKLADTQLELCEKNKVQIYSIWDNEYPTLLKNISYPPNLIFVKGQLQKPDSVAISIVGTRKCTQYGRLTAERYAAYFAQKNIIVVSGLAYGIDSYAHRATVNNNGITYAVIASGIDKLSPSYAVEKAEKIIDSGGAIISHFFCGVTALPPYFLQRNRIISGISSAVLIVESAKRGGSLNTARYAAEESREVFAIPGNISSEKSVGTNLLIQSGTAYPTLKPQDLILQLGLEQTEDNDEEIKEIKHQSKEEEKIYKILNHEPIHIDIIAEKTNFEITTVLVTLLDMEFRSLVRQLPGKFYIREN